MWEGDGKSTLTVPDLKPNTPYSCRGGMLVKVEQRLMRKKLSVILSFFSVFM